MPEAAEEKWAEAELDDIYTAAGKGDNETVKKLIERGVPVDKANEDGTTPLYIASVRDRTETARLLIESKAAIDKANKDGATPLHVASYLGNTGTARLLIESKAAVDKADEDGATPLFIASRWGKTDTARLLIESKAAVDKATKDGTTPLIAASAEGKTDTARLLIESKAAVDKADIVGDTPLIIASYACHMPVVELLVESGADITIRGSGNMTALDNVNGLALSRCDKRAIKKFLEDHQRKRKIRKYIQKELRLAKRRKRGEIGKTDVTSRRTIDRKYYTSGLSYLLMYLNLLKSERSAPNESAPNDIKNTYQYRNLFTYGKITDIENYAYFYVNEEDLIKVSSISESQVKFNIIQFGESKNSVQDDKKLTTALDNRERIHFTSQITKDLLWIKDIKPVGSEIQRRLRELEMPRK